MYSFKLKLSFNRLNDLIINNGECWVVKTTDSDLVNSFFSWIDGNKYDPAATLEYTSGSDTKNDQFIIRKFISTLRFSSGLNGGTHFYYQQRYHATENDDVQTLAGYLGEIVDPYFSELAVMLGLTDLYKEKINMLSTGEFRKAVLLKSAMAGPSVMFLDDPCTGMDAGSCRLFNQLFEHLVLNGTSLVIFTPAGHSSGFRTNILELEENKPTGYNIRESAGIPIPATWCRTNYLNAFELKGITARYDGHEVLHDISWTVNRNEKWSLTGHNGAGKSTLLSFVYADNPQVYSNDVWLFDRKRGTGESIWEVKDQIGYYSTEFHGYFNKMQTVERAISSIIFQNPYEKRVLAAEEERFREQLTAYFELDRFRDKLLCEIPSVSQKLVILTGVFLKNTPLLILDEPFQGFSESLINKCIAFLTEFVSDRTLIMVSHNYAEFPGCINRHFHLERGKGKEMPGLLAGN